MAVIQDGKVSEFGWQRVAAFLLAFLSFLATLTLALLVYFGGKALATLDTVSAAVIRHEVEIVNMKQEINLLRAGKSRSELMQRGPTRLSIRGRAGKPRPGPFSVPRKDRPNDAPAPAPQQPQPKEHGRVWEIKK